VTRTHSAVFLSVSTDIGTNQAETGCRLNIENHLSDRITLIEGNDSDGIINRDVRVALIMVRGIRAWRAGRTKRRSSVDLTHWPPLTVNKPIY
jgi:hypothetical protein